MAISAPCIPFFSGPLLFPARQTSHTALLTKSQNSQLNKDYVLVQAANNRTGLVRSIVKDSNDQNQTSTLDSDGKYNNNDPWGANAVYKNVSDGAWHMVTVTTRTDVQHGFLLYIDGQAAGMTQP